jgi:hypothetical protein
MRPDSVGRALGVRLLLAAVLLLPGPSAAWTQTIDEKNSSWNCLLFFRLGDGATAMTGRYAQGLSFDGSQSSGVYALWGTTRAEWAISGPPDGMRKRLIYFALDAPMLRDPKGVYGYLLGDGHLVSTITVLNAEDFRRGYSSSPSASFGGSGIEQALERYDQWTLVLRSGDGTELFRRPVSLPDRQARAEALKVHRAAIEAAWQTRDPSLLETTPADALPRDRANCLLSTPESREIIENSTVDPVASERRAKPGP